MKYEIVASLFVELFMVDAGDHLPHLPFNRFPWAKKKLCRPMSSRNDIKILHIKKQIRNG